MQEVTVCLLYSLVLSDLSASHDSSLMGHFGALEFMNHGATVVLGRRVCACVFYLCL